MPVMRRKSPRRSIYRKFRALPQLSLIALLVSWPALAASQQLSPESQSLQLSRPVRPWEFLPVTGQRAALLGNESGEMEAWVYPLKIFRGLQLKFHTRERVEPAETLARTLTVRPESASILYASDTYRVRETFFVPVKEQGALIIFEIETEQPLEIEVLFHRDFQLEWPAALGATFIDWLPQQNAFYLGEEQRKFAALIGSPTAAQPKEEYATNYSESQQSSFRLGVTEKGNAVKLAAVAASINGLAEAEDTYHRLVSGYADLQRESADYYGKYLRDTAELTIPDEQLQQAFDWARISTVQGLVTNPYLGTGLVAGYRTSGESQRPGFAWFFGRDSFWTCFALNAEGDFATSRAALDFISKYQREDGKLPHEISQGASFVNWFKDYPYPYASADATPLYIIAVNDYVARSGDVAYANEKWTSLQKAYDFLRSTYDENGFAKNQGIGHGWVEGGPLLPVKTELYQTAVSIEALRALANLAHLTEKNNMRDELLRAFDQQQKRMEQAFWLPEAKRYASALDLENKPINEMSVLSTVPMWFGLLDGAHAGEMISQLSVQDHQADWGMRIISTQSKKFSGGGYHYGSVWPLFTGWASVGEYKYHRIFPAYENLRGNALLALDGSLGHVTEVLSGDYYQPLSTSSPHQIWSAAMVISPMLRGLLGLDCNAAERRITFAPHIPSDWQNFSARNLPVGQNSKLIVNYKATDTIWIFDFSVISAEKEYEIDFRPAVSLRAKVQKVELNGKPLEFHLEETGADQHVVMHFRVGEPRKTLKIFLSRDFGISVNTSLPELGEESRGVRILAESWTPARDQMELQVEGLAGQHYELAIRGANQLREVEGAELSQTSKGSVLRVLMPAGAGGSATKYVTANVIFHFQ